MNAPDLVPSEAQNAMPGGPQGSNDFTGQNWLSEEQQLPRREAASAGSYNGGDVMLPTELFGAASRNYMDNSSSGGTNDSPNTDGVSNRPTPNSSSASDHRQSTTGASVNTPFDASPIGSTNRNPGTQADMDAAVAAVTSSTFFPESMPGGYSMAGSGGGGTGGGTGLTPGRGFTMPDAAGNEFTVPNGWGNIAHSMTPVAEGMLRSLMEMPMDSLDNMDLSGWESGN